MNETQYICVYGSLREGGTNYNKICNEPSLRKIGYCITEDKYSFIGTMSGAYPYATNYQFEDVDKVNIMGELYEVINPDYLQELDKLEYNYIREIITVIAYGKKYNANMYFVVDKDIIDGVIQNLYPNGRKRFYNIKTGDWSIDRQTSNTRGCDGNMTDNVC